MIVKKTIQCKIIALTNTKKQTLDKEYNNLQEFLQVKRILWWDQDLGENLYSANKQQAERFYKTIHPGKEYPISLRKDLIQIEKKPTKITNHWIRIRVKNRRRFWVPIKTYKDFSEDTEFCESKVIKKKNTYFINITIQKKVNIKSSYSSILSIDLGEKVIATSVALEEQRPQFHGREVRGIRRKYSYIRKQLGRKRLLKEIKRFGQREKRKVKDILHKISRQIVEQAEQNNAVIVLGNLKGIRNSSRGKRMNRIVSSMPYFKLTQYIEYKANWKGIKVIKIPEKNTSRICSRCGSKGKRPHQGLFICNSCGYQVNADFNASKNILNSSLDYMSREGVVVNQPKTHLKVGNSHVSGGMLPQEDPHGFRRE